MVLGDRFAVKTVIKIVKLSQRIGAKNIEKFLLARLFTAKIPLTTNLKRLHSFQKLSGCELSSIQQSRLYSFVC